MPNESATSSRERIGSTDYERVLDDFTRLSEEITTLIRAGRTPSSELFERESRARLRLVAVRLAARPRR
jgi:hypothetical protein